MKKFLTTILLFCVFILTEAPAFAEMVMFNVQTLKYHSISCRHAQKCTANCIKIERKEAIRRGGSPCKVCGG